MSRDGNLLDDNITNAGRRAHPTYLVLDLSKLDPLAANLHLRVYASNVSNRSIDLVLHHVTGLVEA